MWKRPVDIDALNDASRDTLMQSLGIRITQITDDTVYGTLPVDSSTAGQRSQITLAMRPVRPSSRRWE